MQRLASDAEAIDQLVGLDAARAEGAARQVADVDVPARLLGAELHLLAALLDGDHQVAQPDAARPPGPRAVVLDADRLARRLEVPDRHAEEEERVADDQVDGEEHGDEHQRRAHRAPREAQGAAREGGAPGSGRARRLLPHGPWG
jgi:hypothetical protein